MAIVKEVHLVGKWICKAAALGDEEALKLASLTGYIVNKSTPTEADFAFEWLERAAKLKDAEARYVLGLCYEAGYMVPQEYMIAASLFLLAACQGHKQAQLKTAESYALGKGAPRNLLKANSWKKKALSPNSAMEQLDILNSIF